VCTVALVGVYSCFSGCVRLVYWVFTVGLVGVYGWFIGYVQLVHSLLFSGCVQLVHSLLDKLYTVQKIS
jgi:hypothetical protein